VVKKDAGQAYLALCLVLLLVSVSVRSLAGGVLAGSWRDSTAMVLVLSLTAVAGKALGGAVADWLGWRLVAVAALVIAAPVVGAAVSEQVAGMIGRLEPAAAIGMFLVQVTMAVTLAAVYVALPRRPGTAFGLPSLALLAGAVPGYAGLLAPYRPALLVLPLLLVSAGMLFFGLGFVARAGEPTSDRCSNESEAHPASRSSHG
jgi:hypothetical protein